MTDLSFTDLGVAEPLRRAVEAQGYTVPTPIQLRAIPIVLSGRDLMGIAQTGTGKTAAFGLPLLQRLAEAREPLRPKHARALILAPTRELATQIHDSLKVYGRHFSFRHAVILGGVNQHQQIVAMSRGVDILVATPGRLLDLVNKGQVQLGAVTALVIDEADRMLDMGFIRDVRKIVAKLPKVRQSLMFSATMPPEVAALVGDILHNPERVDVAPPATTAERIEQRVYFVDAKAKQNLLHALLAEPGHERVIVFTRTKHRANRVSEQLEKNGFGAEAIHGNKSQNARQRALQRFKSGEVRILVATDIAARGIDVPGVTHVFNFELPNEPDSYVHRVGRTARAGAQGIAVSFCDGEERGFLRDIERTTRIAMTVVQGHPMAHVSAGGGSADSTRHEDGHRGGHRDHQGRGNRRGAQTGPKRNNQDASPHKGPRHPRPRRDNCASSAPRRPERAAH